MLYFLIFLVNSFWLTIIISVCIYYVCTFVFCYLISTCLLISQFSLISSFIPSWLKAMLCNISLLLDLLRLCYGLTYGLP